MVTVARLVPMPLLAYWIYAGTLWPAMVLGTIVACTDFVDGYLARKHGPTVFGGLLDPIADKVFVALIYLPFADLGTIPAWACALMFVREFVVTALRSAYEQRGMSMKTSYLAKVKTWTQMQGIGVLLLFPMLGDSPVLDGLLVTGIVAPLVAMAALYLARRRLWTGALVMSGSFVALGLVHLQDDVQLTMTFIMLFVLALTWASGVDYLVGGVRQLAGRGDVGRADVVRLLGALAMAPLAFAVARQTDAPSWPLLVILAAELAMGGLDNLLSHHRVASGALGWSARVGGVCALLAAALLAPGLATALAIAAAVVSTVGVGWEFWRGRDYYVDARLRDKAASAAGAPALGAQTPG